MAKVDRGRRFSSHCGGELLVGIHGDAGPHGRAERNASQIASLGRGRPGLEQGADEGAGVFRDVLGSKRGLA